MLARLSPQNAASTFGASIEQALQGVDVRVKRLEDQPGYAPLEEALRSTEARLQRLERERDGQARTLERVETLVASRVQDLRQSMNRSLEVIVDKVKGETENLRSELGARDAQLRKDLGQELDGVRDLRRLVDGVSSLEVRVQTDLKATKDVCIAATMQLSSVDECLGQLRASVAALPAFLWSLSLGEPPARHPDMRDADAWQHQHAFAEARGRPQQSTATGLAGAGGLLPAALSGSSGPGFLGLRARSGSSAPPTAGRGGGREASADSESTEELPSPRRREVQDAATRGGDLARWALSEGTTARAASVSAEKGSRRRGLESWPVASALHRSKPQGVAKLAGEALADAAAAGGKEYGRQSSIASELSMARAAGEALLDAVEGRRF